MLSRPALLNRATAGIFATVIGVGIAAGVSVAPQAAWAQSSDEAELIDVGGVKMTLEELEAYLEKQKAELEAVKENRAAMRTEQERIKEDLERIQAEQQSAQTELEKLCAELKEAGTEENTDAALCEQ